MPYALQLTASFNELTVLTPVPYWVSPNSATIDFVRNEIVGDGERRISIHARHDLRIERVEDDWATVLQQEIDVGKVIVDVNTGDDTIISNWVYHGGLIEIAGCRMQVVLQIMARMNATI